MLIYIRSQSCDTKNYRSFQRLHYITIIFAIKKFS